jgi:putative endonuclease
VAVRLLRSKGHRILCRNWRAGHGEVDIVSVDGTVLVFVEVKTRRETDRIGGFAPAVSAAKKRVLRIVIERFMILHGDNYPHFRFDVVEVLTRGNLFAADHIFHYEGVPLGDF